VGSGKGHWGKLSVTGKAVIDDEKKNPQIIENSLQ